MIALSGCKWSLCQTKYLASNIVSGAKYLSTQIVRNARLVIVLHAKLAYFFNECQLFSKNICASKW